MVNRERLADTFKWLVSIDSVSREEGVLCRAIQKKLGILGASIHIDDAAEKVGGDSGNLIAKFNGSQKVPPMMFNAHMDTVEPGRGIRPVFKDGLFTSSGDTILGADDKSAIAILMEALSVVKENALPHGPVELVLTVCEEVGLLGAKHLDFGRIDSKFGFTLDATDTRGIMTRAPALNLIDIEVYGKDAHAGAEPEKGINAICLAAKALSKLEVGRIDDETTCNIGLVEGGVARNIVPSKVVLKGEARSLDEKKLGDLTRSIQEVFEKNIPSGADPENGDGAARFSFRSTRDFSATNIPETHPVVQLAKRAAKNLGREMTCKTTGGGADANIFSERGIVTGVIGTGMTEMHSVRESVHLDDMVKTTELVLEMIRMHGEVAYDSVDKSGFE